MGIRLLANMAATIEVYGDFVTLNNYNSCIYSCIDLKPAEVFQNGVLYLVQKFCQQICQIFVDVIAK